MAKRIYVTPVVEVFRDPVSMEPLPKEGAWKEFSYDWERARLQGDVTFSDTGPETATDAPSKPKK